MENPLRSEAAAFRLLLSDHDVAETLRRIEAFIAAHPDAYIELPRGRRRGFSSRGR